MFEISKLNDIDDESVTKYILNGIHDGQSNKAMLYTVNNLSEFKFKLLAYEQAVKKDESKQRKHVRKEMQNAYRNQMLKQRKGIVCVWTSHNASNCSSKKDIKKNEKEVKKGDVIVVY